MQMLHAYNISPDPFATGAIGVGGTSESGVAAVMVTGGGGM